jgi:hypothetical protein
MKLCPNSRPTVGHVAFEVPEWGKMRPIEKRRLVAPRVQTVHGRGLDQGELAPLGLLKAGFVSLDIDLARNR